MHDRRYGNQLQVPRWERYKLARSGWASETAGEGINDGTRSGLSALHA